MAQAFHPPSLLKSGGQPSDDGLHELAASRWHGPPITWRPVVSYTTFSPLPSNAWRRLFSSALSCRRRQLPFSEVERPLLPGLSSRTCYGTGGRPWHCIPLFYGKVSHFRANGKIKWRWNDFARFSCLHYLLDFTGRSYECNAADYAELTYVSEDHVKCAAKDHVLHHERWCFSVQNGTSCF